MSTAKTPKRKPYADFPLTLHATGQWCKKTQGKIDDFGSNAESAFRSILQSAMICKQAERGKGRAGAVLYW